MNQRNQERMGFKVSKDMGISEPTISRYLARKGLPSKGNYNKILRYAKMESEEFLKGEP